MSKILGKFYSYEYLLEYSSATDKSERLESKLVINAFGTVVIVFVCVFF